MIGLYFLHFFFFRIFNFAFVVLDNSGLSVGSIAGGGRYDNLVQQFGGELVPCIGFSVGVERIFAILEAREESKEERTRPCATEVLVFSTSNSKTDDYMKQRMKILTMLRQADIPVKINFIYTVLSLYIYISLFLG